MRGPVLPGADQACHHMKTAVAKRGGVLQRLLEPALEFAFPSGQGSDAPLAGRPIPGRRIEQRLRQAVFLQPRLEIGGRELVGKQELHAGEDIPRRRLEAVQEGMFGVHHGQVGSQTRHCDSL
ncbi:hypothetical protein D9M69_656730 [compost metagenome]